MTFNNNSRLDPSQVQDRRGWSRGSKMAVGGGGIGIVILIVALLLGFNPNDLANLTTDQQPQYPLATPEVSDLSAVCQTGADANARQDCAIVGYVNSIQSYWSEELPQLGANFYPAQTVLYSGSTDAACGYASSAMGPFYCPDDQSIYLDLSFFEELQTRFGAQGGPFAEAYVVAHEYGHHVQDLLGILSSPTSSDEAIYTELQADCLAGIWMNHAVQTGYISQVTEQDIALSLDAAAAVGDDRIQRETQGYVSPESWTHGSSAERQAALTDGLQSGDPNTCDSPGWTP